VISSLQGSRSPQKWWQFWFQPPLSDPRMTVDPVYRAAFERLWDEHSSQMVSNAKYEHAAALIAVFLQRAKLDVVIFCRELKEEVYDDPAVLSALESALCRPNLRIEVVVQNQAPEGSKFAAALIAAKVKSDKITFTQNISEPAKSFALNFAYVDGHAYRLEKDHGQTDAMACAWGEPTVVLLHKLFCQLKGTFTHVTPVADPNPGRA
jgi:prepilin-type processing-associated H-X9-DG protein